MSDGNGRCCCTTEVDPAFFGHQSLDHYRLDIYVLGQKYADNLATLRIHRLAVRIERQKGQVETNAIMDKGIHSAIVVSPPPAMKSLPRRTDVVLSPHANCLPSI